MLDGYNRVVKNMTEEGTELLGYSSCWLASVRYLWRTRPARARAAAVEPVTHRLPPNLRHTPRKPCFFDASGR